MKAVFAILSFALLIAVGTLEAQNEPSIPVAEPQYINSFSAVDANGELIELERQTVAFRTKTKVFPGYASVKMTTEFKPGISPVRVAANQQFVVRGRAPIDPLSLFELRLLKGSKDHREFLMVQGHGSAFVFSASATATANPEEGAIAIRFEEYGANSYRITPERPLPPGEYALAVRGLASELYFFGVDR